MERIHIYFVDEKSRRWLITNEIIGSRYANERYDGKFINVNWSESDGFVYTRVKFYDGRTGLLQIPISKVLKISRNLKLEYIQNNKITTDFLSIKEREKVNQLRFEKLEHVCNSNESNRYRFGNGTKFTLAPHYKNKPTKKELRQQYAKGNRSYGKSKNK